MTLKRSEIPKILDTNSELHCIDGSWHEIRFGRRDSAALTSSAFDVLKRKHVWPGKRYAKSSRPLADAECLAHGVKKPGPGQTRRKMKA